MIAVGVNPRVSDIDEEGEAADGGASAIVLVVLMRKMNSAR